MTKAEHVLQLEALDVPVGCLSTTTRSRLIMQLPSSSCLNANGSVSCLGKRSACVNQNLYLAPRMHAGRQMFLELASQPRSSEATASQSRPDNMARPVCMQPSQARRPRSKKQEKGKTPTGRAQCLVTQAPLARCTPALHSCVCSSKVKAFSATTLHTHDERLAHPALKAGIQD